MSLTQHQLRTNPAKVLDLLVSACFLLGNRMQLRGLAGTFRFSVTG